MQNKCLLAQEKVCMNADQQLRLYFSEELKLCCSFSYLITKKRLGTLLQECVVRSPASHLTCIVLDTNEMIHVDVNAIEELNEVKCLVQQSPFTTCN